MTRHVYIVDDDDAVRMSLHSLLSLQSDLLVGSFRNGDMFLEHAQDLAPGVLLLDFHMSGSSGMDVLRNIRQPGLAKFATIILTGEGNIGVAVQAMKAGALDLIEKPFEAALLIDTVDAAFSILAQDGVAAARAEQARAQIEGLSQREREVLMSLLQGRANKVIAVALDISPRTVEIYRANLLEKLNVRSLPAALRIAFAAGCIPANPVGPG
jgi:two-component system response regulator FixJ